MQDTFVPPSIPATDHNCPPPCPRRLLNERVYRQRADETEEAPLTGARKMRLRYTNERPSILVNDAGMVREPTITGVQQ